MVLSHQTGVRIPVGLIYRTPGSSDPTSKLEPLPGFFVPVAGKGEVMSDELRDRWGRPLRTAKSRVRSNWFKSIFGRLWYIAIPGIGIICAQDAYVRPHLVDDENTINLGRVATDLVTDSLLADLRVIDGETATLQAEIDSTWAPQVMLYRSVLDSLIAVRREYDGALPAAEAKVDSLELVLAELQESLQKASADVQERQLAIDGMKIERRALRDSIQALTGEIEELADVYDRLANPDDYRKNTALIPGPGNYPDRDNLPPR